MCVCVCVCVCVCGTYIVCARDPPPHGAGFIVYQGVYSLVVPEIHYMVVPRSLPVVGSLVVPEIHYMVVPRSLPVVGSLVVPEIHYVVVPRSLPVVGSLVVRCYELLRGLGGCVIQFVFLFPSLSSFLQQDPP